jgi:hypothetical protein
MSIDVERYEPLVRKAVATFWSTRSEARGRVEEGVDVGNRSLVTSGKNMDGFVELALAVVTDHGLPASSVFGGAFNERARRRTVLPGFYRPTKDWDLVVVHEDRLVAALEFKSQVGSLGNNFNNRVEEALGMGEDLRVAFREGTLGPPPKPFVGYLMLLGDEERARRPVRITSHHLPTDPAFDKKSYVGRYEIFCERLMREQLYDAAALILSPREEGSEGAFAENTEQTGVFNFLAGLAAAVEIAAARRRSRE